MKTTRILISLTLLAALPAALPTASAFDCDGDPMYWNRDYPTYYVCETAEGPINEAPGTVEVWVRCLTRTGPCPP